jgi:hypothetical protein
MRRGNSCDKYIATIVSEGVTWVYEGDVQGLEIWVEEEFAKPKRMSKTESTRLIDNSDEHEINVKRA